MGRTADHSPAYDARAITPHDTNILTAGACRSLYVGVAGDIAATMVSGTDVTFKAAPVGVLPVQVKVVKSTGTTATNILALY